MLVFFAMNFARMLQDGSQLGAVYPGGGQLWVDCHGMLPVDESGQIIATGPSPQKVAFFLEGMGPRISGKFSRLVKYYNFDRTNEKFMKPIDVFLRLSLKWLNLQNFLENTHVLEIK